MATGSVVDHTRELVVLVHGLWMPGAASSLLGLRLRKLGFDTANFSYPSVRSTLDEAAVRLGRFVAAHRSPRVHFVGHSLGGLVVMTMLHGSNIRSLGRAVLLGSPCNGCAAAVQLAGRRGWSMLLGRALPHWRGDQTATINRPVEVGVIAGTRRFGLGCVFVTLQGPNDGVVTVEETRLPGLTDHLVMPVTHSGMIVSARVARQVGVFLKTGRFDMRDATSS